MNDFNIETINFGQRSSKNLDGKSLGRLLTMTDRWLDRKTNFKVTPSILAPLTHEAAFYATISSIKQRIRYSYPVNKMLWKTAVIVTVL